MVRQRRTGGAFANNTRGVTALGVTAGSVVVGTALAFYGSYRLYEWVTQDSNDLTQKKIAMLVSQTVKVRDAQASVFHAEKKKVEAEKKLAKTRVAILSISILCICLVFVLKQNKGRAGVLPVYAAVAAELDKEWRKMQIQT